MSPISVVLIALRTGLPDMDYRVWSTKWVADKVVQCTEHVYFTLLPQLVTAGVYTRRYPPERYHVYPVRSSMDDAFKIASPRFIFILRQFSKEVNGAAHRWRVTGRSIEYGGISKHNGQWWSILNVYVMYTTLNRNKFTEYSGFMLLTFKCFLW